MSDKILLSAYQKANDVDIDEWLLAESEAKPESPKPEEKPAEKKDEGGFFNSIGGWAKKAADVIYPPAPVEGASLPRRMVEGAVETMAGGAQQIGEAYRGNDGPTLSGLVTGQQPEPRFKDTTIGGVTIPAGVVRAATGVMGAFNVTPLGGAIGAAAPAGEDATKAREAVMQDFTDEALKSKIALLESGGGARGVVSAPGDAPVVDVEQIQRLKNFLMMPYDKRVEMIAQEGGQAASMAAGVMTMKAPEFLGLGRLIGKTGVPFQQAQAAAKASRAEAVGRAAERATAAPKAAEAEVGAAAKSTRPHPLDADEKLAILQRDPEAKQAIDETFVQHAPKGEPSVPEGHVRLYRSEGPRDGKPTWKDPDMEQFQGRWFSPDRALSESHGKDVAGAKARTLYVDVPQDVYEASKVAGRPEMEKFTYGGAQDAETALLSADVAGSAKPISGGDRGVSLIEDVRFKGEKPHELQHGENMVVAQKDGQDVGYLWYTRVGEEGSGAGYTVRKVFVDPSARRQGVASELYEQVAKYEGPRLGSTDKTPEGAAFTAALEKRKPAIFGKGVAPKELADDVLDIFQGDADVAEAALRRYGYRSVDYGIKELPELHSALNLSKAPSGAAKTFAQDATLALAHDLGVLPSVASDAVPAMAAVVKGIPAGDLKTVRQIVEQGMKDPESPLSALRAMQFGGAGQEGKISAGTLFVIGRAALGAVAGSMSGDDPESAARNAFLAAGFSAFLSPRLARAVLENVLNPEVRDGLKAVLTSESGAINLRFPGRGVGKKPSPNTERMGATPEAKRLVRGINEKLEKAGELSRANVKTHEQTIQDALTSPYRSVEAVMELDTAKLSLAELDGALTAARGVRDFVLEDVIQTAARAKLSGDPAVTKEVVDKFLLSGKVSQRVTDFQTAVARAQGAGNIKSDAAIASKFNLDELDGEINTLRDALLSRGKVSDTQLVEMLTNLADAAATRQLANAASKWPEALWSIYYGLNLLGSPLTQFRNMLGNAGALGMAVVDRGFGEIIALPFHAAGKGKNMVQPGETYEMVSGIVSTVLDSFRGGKDVKGAFGYGRDAFKSGESIFGMGKETTALQVIESAGENSLPRVIQAMAALGNANMRFMGGTDEFFKVLSFQGELRTLARRQARSAGKRGDDFVAEYHRLIDEPDQSMLAQATAFAKENTFTKQFTPGAKGGWRTAFGAGAALEDAANNPLMKATVTPFFRTPVRIGEFATVHTPGLNILATQFWSDMAEGGAKANLAAAKLATGSAVMLGVYWFATHGYITGTAPADPKLRLQYEEAGWQEKSIYNPINGKYYSYDNLEPLSTLIATASTVVQMGKDLPEQTLSDLFMAGTIAAAKNSLSKQWFSGISDFLDAVESGVRGEDTGAMVKLIARRMSALIPGAAIQRQFNKMTDSEKRELKTVVDNENPELREFSSFMNIIKSNIAGWGQSRPAMVNMITGEPVANENTWLQAFNPFAVTTYKNDKVLNELVALEGAGLPREIPRVLGGSQPSSPFKLPGQEEKEIREGVILSDPERQRLGVLLTKTEDHDGNTLHKALGELMDTEEYQDASDGRYGGKSDLIASKFNEFMEQAKEQLLEEYPKLDQIIARRQLERGLGKFPKSMEDLKEPLREMAR